MVLAVFLLWFRTCKNGPFPVCKLGASHVDADFLQLCRGFADEGMEKCQTWNIPGSCYRIDDTYNLLLHNKLWQLYRRRADQKHG